MGCCTLKCVVKCGIFLAVLDIINSLTAFGFYGYQYVIEMWYLCPIQLAVEKCHNKIYIFEQMFLYRCYFGVGEGVLGIAFCAIYIVALVKRKPSLTWFWIIKAFAVIGINIYYLSNWVIRQGRYDHLEWEKQTYEDEFIWAAEALTLLQIFILFLYLLIGSMFTYKIVEEKRASRRSLRSRRKWNSRDDTAASGDVYDDEEGQYLTQTLTNSEKTLAVRASKQSLAASKQSLVASKHSLSHPPELDRGDTFKHSTGV